MPKQAKNLCVTLSPTELTILERMQEGGCFFSKSETIRHLLRTAPAIENTPSDSKGEKNDKDNKLDKPS